MIKIAYIIDTIESPTAGTEKQLLMLIKHLDRSKFQPYLCVLRTSEWLKNEFDLCPMFVANILSFKSFKGLWAIRTLSQFLENNAINIVQTHFRDASIAGIVAARLALIPCVIGTRRNQGYWMTAVDRLIQKYLDRWVTCYIANSQNTKQWQIETEKISEDRIHVIHNGFDLSKFDKIPKDTRGQIRKALDIPYDALVVTIVANLRGVKDHKLFLKAAQRVYASQPASHFILVGNGPEQATLQSISSDLGIDRVVYFLGMRHDIPEILGASDIGVLSSKSESFSNAVVEYMAAGLPVVATDVGGVREAIEDGVTGYVVPAGDWKQLAKQILEVMSSGCMRKMGEINKIISNEKFSLVKMIETTEIIYLTCHTLIENKRVE
jgi:glycosyltransferase involved in cell wall biosynthesis